MAFWGSKYEAGDARDRTRGPDASLSAPVAVTLR